MEDSPFDDDPTVIQNQLLFNNNCDTFIQKVITALQRNQFTTIFLNKTLKQFIAQKSKRFSFYHCDHTVTRYMEDSPFDDDPTVIKNQLKNSS